MGGWTLDVFGKCKTCGHTMMEHIFLMADVGHCFVDDCDCLKFEGVSDGNEEHAGH